MIKSTAFAWIYNISRGRCVSLGEEGPWEAMSNTFKFDI